MRALRPALVTAIVLGALAAAPPASAAVDGGFRFDFADRAALGEGVVVDVSGNGNDGSVRTDDGGALDAFTGYRGTTSVDFPDRCSLVACPQAIVRVADAPSLTVARRPFTFGAQVLLPRDQTDAGENVVQKGLWSDPGGQWKLQVDGLAGRPSCVVSGDLDGARHRTKVTSDVSVADGAWHQVACSRTSTGVAVLVDGDVTGFERSGPVEVTNDAAVTVGGKNVLLGTDQFHGALDDVFLSIG